MNIGSIVLDWFTPLVSRDASPAGKGQTAVTISGAGYHAVVDELEELVSNYRNRITRGGETGILQYIDFDCASLANRKGWYLLQGFSDTVDKVHMDAIASLEVDLGHGDTAVLSFSLKAVYLGDQP